MPRVRVDFGDGSVLETTLGGNVVTWYCLPDGRAFDVLPGVTSGDHYLESARGARALSDRLVDAEPERLEYAAHSELYSRSGGWTQHFGIGFGADLVPLTPVDLGAAQPFPSRDPALALDALEVTVTKAAIEAPILRAIEPPRPASLDEALAADRAMVESLLRPQARAVLAARPLASPHALAPHVFRLVLKIDLDDPYLGMGSVFGE